jgi:hypothetical protein
MVSAKVEVVSPGGASESLPRGPTERPSHTVKGLSKLAKKEEGDSIVDLERFQVDTMSTHTETSSNYFSAVEAIERGLEEKMKRVRSIEDLGKCVERTRRESCCGIEGCNMADNTKRNMVKKRNSIRLN